MNELTRDPALRFVPTKFDCDPVIREELHPWER